MLLEYAGNHDNDIVPLLTAGDEDRLLLDGKGTPHAKLNCRIAGAMDGMGLIEAPGESLPGKPACLTGIQASSLVPSGVVEGGQVLLARPRR
ncbi:MAG TPA: hypothetical protein VET88_10690 [Gammaproteobacteria bacterium]|nr:hypothetical protein [Gammaproteobacteria bacterium]